MSIWAVTWALHSKVPDPAHKLVLISLASFADDEDRVFVSAEELSRLASTSPSELVEAIRALEAAGLLAEVGVASGAYQLVVPDVMPRPGRRG